MKTILTLPRIALLAAALGTACTNVALAQDSSSSDSSSSTAAPSTSGPLTADEKAQLDKAKEQAEANDPDLKTQGDALKARRATIKTSSDEDKAAFKSDYAEFQKKLHEAELAIDPTLGPIIAKVEALEAKRANKGGGA